MGGSPENLQLWGGVECTVNRVADRYFDQLEYSGHSRRITDLDAIAALGVRALRYPVLWERVEQASGQLCFRWADERLERLQKLAVEPIVGLVHHGSGPNHTSLVTPCFAEKLATYAGQVAERYPWLEKFTPINEPLTTARFSGLYGHWHPHGRDDRTFVRALLTQCKSIVLAMSAIRRVTPTARLVQTEDMGFTRGTDAVQYQADFENERRWLSLDLLAGKVSRSHPLYRYLIQCGASAQELGFFEQHPCPADIIGINYYVTSERFLDSRVSLYPSSMVGGNGRQAYVDVEAVRVCADGLIGPGPILSEAHDRYQRPVVVTEAHIGCEPRQQASWLSYVWRSAHEARQRGADIRAVTVWALLGAFGWDRLVTEGRGRYEAGVFHVASGELQETELAHFVRSLARGEHPETDAGWWTLPERLLYEPHRARSRAA